MLLETRGKEPPLADQKCSGLAWHTEETTLRQKFEEFGVVDEAVRALSDAK